MSTANRENNFVLQDVAIVVLSVIVAVILAKTGVLIQVFTATQELRLLGGFIAGIFFTSVFTAAPAIIALGEIAQANSVWDTAIAGALGAVVGDLIIFRFIRDRLAEHMLELLKHRSGGKRIRALLKMKMFRWFTFLMGGLIIASPLPDELGVSLLGLSNMSTSRFIPISFIFNFVGILLIGLVAQRL